MARHGGKKSAVLFIVLIIAASVVLVRNLALLKETPFTLTRTLHTPSVVAVAQDGSMAVIENSKMTVSLLDAEGRLRARIRGGSYDTDAFYYAEHIATDGESIVMAEVRHTENSTFVAGERLLRYDLDGDRLETLYTVDYKESERPRQLGRIRNVSLLNGKVYFTWVNGATAGVSVCENGTARVLRFSTLQDDHFLSAVYQPALDIFCFTSKKGLLGVSEADGSVTYLPYGDGQNVPWSAGVSDTGDIVVSELVSKSVESVREDGAHALWTGGLVYDLNAANGHMSFSDGDRIYVLDDTGKVLFDAKSVRLSTLFAITVVFTWLSAVFLFLVICWIVVRLFRLMRHLVLSEARRRMLIAAGSVLVTVTVVMAVLFSFLGKQMQRQTIHSLSSLAESISATSSTMLGQRLDTIRALSDYLNPDYNAVRAYMDAFCDASYRNGSNLYYILYRFDGDSLWGVMDYEETTGVHFPYAQLEGTVYQQVISTGKSVTVEGEADIYGMWSYAVAPVYNTSGTVTGLVEIGTNQYGDVVAQDALIRDTLTGVLVALMMAMLLFNEWTALHDYRAHRKLLRARSDRHMALGFIRLLIFLVFMADNMDAAYIPQLSASLGAASAGAVGIDLASALPMSVQLLAIGMSAFLSGRILDQSRPRNVILGGVGLQLIGVALSMVAILSGQYWYLVLAKAIGGLGTGAAVVTCNAMPGRSHDPEEQQRLIAGLNVGVITGVVLGSSVGGYIADYISYPAAYIASAVCILLAALFALHTLRGVAHVTVEFDQNDPSYGKGSSRRFLRNPRVLSFLLCIMLPYMLMMYFKDYLFPLFASGLGKTESVIGSAMLLSGMIAIFLGDILPSALLTRLSAWNALRIASLVCVYALGLFALHPVFETAVITLCLLGVSASFGYAAQGVYYTGLAKEGSISDGKAMGLYSLFDNLGQTSGPLGLSMLLFLGVTAECGVIALSAVGLLGIAGILANATGRKKRI